MISWLISVIVDARSKLEYAKRDKSERIDDNDFKVKVVICSNL